MLQNRVSGLAYGADYNPEQWPEDVWLEDMRLMKEAGVNLISLAIFSWAKLEPAEGEFDFSWLDRIMDLLHANGIQVDLANAAAAVPAWAYQKYPDLFPEDKAGNRLWYGSRQAYCPNSPSYRRLSGNLTRAIAERYKNHPALTMWHINNEYACHVATCYCDTCAAAFRVWLQKKYGSVEAVNHAWGTAFWSQWYYAWEEIMPPRQTTTQSNPTQVLDYRRFMSDSILDCYRNERAVAHEITPEIPITTNFMLEFKPLDYVKWAKEVDIVSWDSYPNPATGVHTGLSAIDQDLMRGLGQGEPYLLMEQSPSQVNWRPINAAKYPGLNRFYSLQNVSRGADGIMYFQWRQSIKGAEKYHAACITHTGDSDSRVFREVAEIGAHLKKLAGVAGSKIPAEVALVYDYDSWWSVEYQPGPSAAVVYRQILQDYYRVLYEANIPVDIVFQESDLSSYKVVIAPLCHMVQNGFAAKVQEFTAAGGVFITNFFSGIVNSSDIVFSGGYPGPFSEVLGIRVEEFNPMEAHMGNTLLPGAPDEQVFTLPETTACTIWSELVNLRGAVAQAVFGEDYLAGEPAVTCNTFGRGEGWYIATRPDADAMEAILRGILSRAGVEPVLATPKGVDVSVRSHGSREKGEWLFILNATREEKSVQLAHYSGIDELSGEKLAGELVLEPLGCRVIKLQ